MKKKRHRRVDPAKAREAIMGGGWYESIPTQERPREENSPETRDPAAGKVGPVLAHPGAPGVDSVPLADDP